MFKDFEIEHDIRDSMKGVVTCCTSKGVYLKLVNGQSAFAHFSKIPIGSNVYCTILKRATERLLTLVCIDSVRELVA